MESKKNTWLEVLGETKHAFPNIADKNCEFFEKRQMPLERAELLLRIYLENYYHFIWLRSFSNKVDVECR